VDVDGQGAKELPISLDELKPGKHTLKFTGDKYRSKEQEISIEDGQTKTIDDVKLTPKAVSTKFVFVTKGAKATLSDGSKTVDLADDGKAIDLDASKSWTLKATAPNFEDLSKSIDFGDDTDQTVKIELNEKGKVAIAPTTPTTSTTPTTPPTGVSTGKTPPVITPPTTAGGDGTLFINTLPGSNCVVNGTPRGHTPMTLSVPPGTYNVTCVAKDGEDTLKKSSSATVESGKKANVIIKLRD
jgi:PEGA domain